MMKINKLLLAITVILTVLVIGVVAQSLSKQIKIKKLTAEINALILVRTSKAEQAKALLTALKTYEPQVSSVIENPSILNISLSSVQAESAICEATGAIIFGDAAELAEEGITFDDNNIYMDLGDGTFLVITMQRMIWWHAVNGCAL